MPSADVCPRILLAFVIFLTHRRGGGFVEIELEIAEASQQQRRRIQYCIDRDSSVEDSLRKCSALLDERDPIAALGSFPAHAALCICLATGLPVSRTSYVAAAAESDQTVQFFSPATDLQGDAYSQTDIKALEHIYQQLVTQDMRTPVSCVELVDVKNEPWFHRLSSVTLPRPKADNFPSLFRSVAQQHSENSAIEAWDKCLTYSDLESASTAVATALRSLGVKRGDTVILALDWSSWAPVCALATMEAAAAFFFIDPNVPTARVNWFLEKVKGHIVLSDASNYDKFTSCSAKVVSVQSLPLDDPVFSPQCQHQEARATDTAYVLFTSGSTGNPKTVLTSHQALCAGAEPQATALGMTERSRVLYGGPLNFAGALPPLLFSLAVGACLCIPQHSQGRIEAAAQYRTNFMSFLTGAASRLDPTRFKTRQTVCIGAEVVPTSTTAAWGRDHAVRVAYGASEMNGIISGCPRESAISSRDIGRCAAHRFWIVDPADHDRLMPPGWPGEVLVQSAALAFAYIGNEAATARAFPPAPAWYSAVAKSSPSTTSAFGEPYDSAVRWYRTGDMGRLDRATLSREVLGRVDQMQLELPGGRVDVTVLEAAAQAAAGRPLGIVVQLGVPRGEGVPRVFAFLQSEHDYGDQQQVRIVGSGVVQDVALRRTLRETWARQASVQPEYAVVVESLPRVHSGKIWRYLLRDWVGEHTTGQLAPWRLSEENGHV